MKQQKTRRNRGVILTLKGWDKLQSAKAEAEWEENGGNNFTLEELSDRTHLALHTISKILGRSGASQFFAKSAKISQNK
ncbi:hypothetical protein [Iningainema tapete]|uniref:hypothetical protein n=1 Tax=Iningainema tapete TaxID=2806730 RepID=UPI001EE24DE3|nr:hypothetical protein [Iningainema tapete]